MAKDDAATHAVALGGDAAHCEAARRYAREHNMPLVQVLVERGLSDADALAERLADAVGTVVVELGRSELDAEILPLAGAELAWRYLILPIAHAGGGLSVAFADPLDRAAMSAIEEAAGRTIEPLVAPYGELRASLQRHYGEPPDGAPMSPEPTKRVEGIAFERSATQPLHRIEDDATMEQRHRALLLALVDAGVLTHEAYLAALRRVMGQGLERES